MRVEREGHVEDSVRDLRKGRRLVGSLRATRRRIPSASRAVDQPGDRGAHAEPAESANGGGDLRVVIENAEAREEIIPIVDDVFRVADCEQRQGLSARVGHVCCDGEKLFEKEKRAKGGASNVSLKRKINGQSEGRKKLQECAAGDRYPLAKETEKHMAAFVDGDENEVNHQERPVAAKRLIEKREIKNQPRDESPSRDGLPSVFEGFKEWEAGGERFRKIHGGAERVRNTDGHENYAQMRNQTSQALRTNGK